MKLTDLKLGQKVTLIKKDYTFTGEVKDAGQNGYNAKLCVVNSKNNKYLIHEEFNGYWDEIILTR